MTYYPELTHNDRRERRKVILRRVREGEKLADVAASYGLSLRYVRQVVADDMGPRVIGRPRLQFRSIEDMKAYRRMRCRYGADIARQIVPVSA